uniref:Uncharacterized protein n=1 Tax=Globodera rostochiensis TaxID=31243 RepID=A0A914H5V1_GLORO
MSKSGSFCSEEDVAANRSRIDEEGELSKADFLGWIAAKCQLLRKSSKSFFEFKALECFSDLVAGVLVKAYASAGNCVERLLRDTVDEMWLRLDQLKLKNHRGIQDVTFIWPFVKEFIENIVSWKERREQSNQNFFIRQAFNENKNASPPVMVTLASPELVDDEPKSLMAMRKRRSAEVQSSGSLMFTGPIVGLSPTLPSWTSKMNEGQSARRDANVEEDEQRKKRRTDTQTDGNEEQQKQNQVGKAAITVKQEIIEVDEQEDAVDIYASKEPPKVGQSPSLNKEPPKVGQSPSLNKEPPKVGQSSSSNLILDVPTRKVANEEQEAAPEREAEDDDDDDLYSLSFGNKSLFDVPEEQSTPKTGDEHPPTAVKREPEESVWREEEQLGKKAIETDRTEGAEDGEVASKEDEDGQLNTDEDEGSVMTSGGTDSSSLPESGEDASANVGQQSRRGTNTDGISKRPYSPIKPALNMSNNCPTSSVVNGGGARVLAAKREHCWDSDDGPLLRRFDAAGYSSVVDDSFCTVINVSPEKRSEFDIFDQPLPPPRPASPAKTNRKYSSKVKIRKRFDYEAEQKLKRRLAIGQKVLRFSDEIKTRSFEIDEGNSMTHSTANDKNLFVFTSSTTNFLKKLAKSKNGVPKTNTRSRRYLHEQAYTDVRNVVAAVEERCKKISKQPDCSGLGIGQSDRLVRFSRLILTDSLLHRLDEGVLKNAYVLRTLEHPGDFWTFHERGLECNKDFLKNPAHLANFEFSYLFVVYGHDQIVQCQCVPDPSEFLEWLRNWFLTNLPMNEHTLVKSYENGHHYFYTPPRIVAVTIPEVDEYTTQFRTFNDQLRHFVHSDSKQQILHNNRFLLLDWARMVAECPDGRALNSEEIRMQMLAMEMKDEFGVLIK